MYAHIYIYIYIYIYEPTCARASLDAPQRPDRWAASCGAATVVALAGCSSASTHPCGTPLAKLCSMLHVKHQPDRHFVGHPPRLRSNARARAGTRRRSQGCAASTRRKGHGSGGKGRAQAVTRWVPFQISEISKNTRLLSSPDAALGSSCAALGSSCAA